MWEKLSIQVCGHNERGNVVKRRQNLSKVWTIVCKSEVNEKGGINSSRSRSSRGFRSASDGEKWVQCTAKTLWWEARACPGLRGGCPPREGGQWGWRKRRCARSEHRWRGTHPLRKEYTYGHRDISRVCNESEQLVNRWAPRWRYIYLKSTLNDHDLVLNNSDGKASVGKHDK